MRSWHQVGTIDRSRTRVRVAHSCGGSNGINPMISQAKETFQFDTIDDVVSDIAKGRIVIVTDDADRENDSDLAMDVEKVSREAQTYTATHMCDRQIKY